MPDKSTVAFIAVIASGLCIGASYLFVMHGGNVSGMNQKAAEKEAEAYAKKLGLAYQGIDCAHDDSDGDGYVSCSISVKQSNGEVRIQPVECAAAMTTNSGCKVPKGSVWK